MKLQDALAEIEALNEALDDEQAGKMDLQNKLSKLNSEFQTIKGKFDEEGQNKIEELEDAKRKLCARVQEMEEALASAESKAASMEKVKNRMNEEVEDLLLDLEKVGSTLPCFLQHKVIWGSLLLLFSKKIVRNKIIPNSIFSKYLGSKIFGTISIFSALNRYLNRYLTKEG